MTPGPSLPAAGWTAAAVIPLLTVVIASLCLCNGYAAVAYAVVVLGLAGQAAVLGRITRRAIRLAELVLDLDASLSIALRDPVTGLPVRRVAEQHLRNAAGTEVTVALIDVDGMHDVNTAFTHDGGDAYLAQLAQRLTDVAGPGDLTARLGGDEFVVISRRPALVLGRALAAALIAPATIGTQARAIRASVGICRAPGGDPHHALGRADRAMYTAKRRGTGIEYYDRLRDGDPLEHGVRPPIRHRDNRTARSATGDL
ncbi:GGDEF domain-containing protein [Dactylosporangium sp. CS-047395]|uniref:GGDEF domain-containing protein n=1 Tax=Dactylosporangium sp. CS-047395 TaxID=3239936 RepID=UPI003D90DFAF